MSKLQWLCPFDMQNSAWSRPLFGGGRLGVLELISAYPDLLWHPSATGTHSREMPRSFANRSFFGPVRFQIEGQVNCWADIGGSKRDFLPVFAQIFTRARSVGLS
jgi:hypothetical protein